MIDKNDRLLVCKAIHCLMQSTYSFKFELYPMQVAATILKFGSFFIYVSGSSKTQTLMLFIESRVN